MAKKTNKKKNIIITAAVVVAAVVAIVVGIVVSREPALDDSFFVSDETKLVMSLNDDIAALEEGPYEPPVTHLVYYYDGDRVTNLKIYFAYDNEMEAETAFNNINMKGKDFATTKRRNGKYIIFDAVKARYEGMTVEQVQRNINAMRAAGGLAS